MAKPMLPPRRKPLHPIEWVTHQEGVEDLPEAKLITLDRIDANPYQPRRRFNQEALDELAASIRAHGLLQPLVVRKVEDRYQLIAGERRRRAAAQTGMEKVPCLVQTISDDDAEILTLLENIQRADLDPLEEAHAYRHLMERFSLSLRDIADRVHKSHELVAQRLRLIADPAVEEAVRSGAMGPSVARELARIADPQKKQDLLRRAAAGERIAVRDVKKALAASRPAKEEPGEPHGEGTGKVSTLLTAPAAATAQREPLPAVLPDGKELGTIRLIGPEGERGTVSTLLTAREPAAPPGAASVPAPQNEEEAGSSTAAIPLNAGDEMIDLDTLSIVRLRQQGKYASRAEVMLVLGADVAALEQRL